MHRWKVSVKGRGRFGAVLALAVAATSAGCSRLPSSVGDYVPPEGPGEPWILATPNPIPAGRGLGRTTISWNTGTEAAGQVYVSVNGGPEKFFSASSYCTEDATGIGRGVHEFRLYAGGDRTKPVGSAKVTRSSR